MSHERAPGAKRSLHFTVALLSSLVLAAGCVGNAESRRGGHQAAYDGPVVTSEGPAGAHLSGRFEKREDGMAYAWPGSSMSVRFKGNAVSAELTQTGHDEYLVIIDGKAKRERLVPMPGRSTVELAKGLPRGEHQVTLYKLTEPLVGSGVFHGFILDKYGEALPVAVPSRRIEIIGDSISAGYGNEGNDPGCAFSPETENHYMTYGARTARALDAELTTLAWSGKGVFSNRGDRNETMSDLWTRSLPGSAESQWAFAADAPEVVLLNLGTNDMAPEEADIAPFFEAYKRLLTEVRGHYPSADIIASVGPLLSDSYPAGRNALSTVRTTLQELVKTRRAGGDQHMHFLEFAAIKSSEGLGCDYHPTVATHMRMASELVAFLRQDLGW